MTRRIKLTRFAVQTLNWQYYGAVRLRVEASDAEGEGLDNHVFIFRRSPVDPYTGEACDEFLAVAGPADMAEFPIEEPNPGSPFFRKDWVECDFRSQSRADEFWTIMQREVCILVEAMGKLSQLEEVETVWCPSPPDAEVSESESSSLSSSI